MEITEIIKAIIYLLLSVASVFLIPWLKGQVGEQKMGEFLKWVDIAVAAAEQLYYSTDGEKKKDYVLAYLEAKGFAVDEDELNMAIEASVNRLHNELYGANKDVSVHA